MATYEKRKSGWTVRFNVFANEESSRTRLSGFPRKSDAEYAYRQYVADYPEQFNMPTIHKIKINSDLTVKKIYLEYIQAAQSSLKESSIYDASSIYTLFIYEKFAHSVISSITKPQLVNWQEDLNEKGYSYKYKTKIRGVFLALFKYANEKYEIKNTLIEVKPFVKPKEKKEMLIWSPEEFNLFINEADDLVYKTYFTFLYYTGLRLGESRAITWEDIDLKKNKINVRRNVTKKGAIGTRGIITTPKNLSSYRTLSMPNNLLIDIKEYHKLHNKGYVFGGSTFLPEQSIRNKLKEYLNNANAKIEEYNRLSDDKKPLIAVIRLHDFRHSHASLLINLGVDIVTVAKRLGHSNIEQTLNTYAHLMPNSEGNLLEKLNNLTQI